MPFRRQIRLTDNPRGEAQDPPPARIPIGDPRHPKQVRGHRITLTRQFAVARPVLGESVVSHVLHLVEGARIEQHESEDPPYPLVEPTRAEHGPMTELVLPGI